MRKETGLDKNMIKNNKKNKSLDINLGFLKISVKKKNYLQKIWSYILNKFAFLYPNKKLYDYIVPLGDNCKYSTKFHYFYKFVDSTLFNWAAIIDKNNLEEIIRHPEEIYSQGWEYEKDRNMWICKKYNISFHGRSLPEELFTDGVFDESKKQADFEELRSRLNYLIEKTQKIFASKEKKLFVYTYEENDYDENPDFLRNLYKLMTEISSNFDFLVITHSDRKYESLENLTKELPNFYVRTIFHKTKDTNWSLVNCEFAPKFKKKQTKKRKFELKN